MTTRRRQAGFTLLELAISVTIIGVLSGVLLQRVVGYQREADLAYAERIVGVLRSALVLHVSHLTAQNRQAEIPALVHANPMTWLEQKPANYVGEYFAPHSAQIPSRSWYFDRRAKLLVYVPARDHFPGAAIFSEPVPALHYRLVLAPVPAGADGTAQAAIMPALIQVK